MQMASVPLVARRHLLPGYEAIASYIIYRETCVPTMPLHLQQFKCYIHIIEINNKATCSTLIYVISGFDLPFLAQFSFYRLWHILVSVTLDFTIYDTSVRGIKMERFKETINLMWTTASHILNPLITSHF